MLRIIVIVLVVLSSACRSDLPAGLGQRAQNPSPMEETVRAHGRLQSVPVEGDRVSIGGLLPREVEVLIRSHASKPDVLIHFHGASFVPFAVGPEVSVIASVNLGSGSSAYERPFVDPSAFPALLDSLSGLVGGPLGRVTLSGWSAGYGAIRAILRQAPGRVDGVILLDGLHTDYVPEGMTLFEGGVLNTDKMGPFLEFARRAAAGQKAMLVTHSEIFPGTYASTTETSRYLLSELGLAATPVLEWGPGGMQLISRAQAGQLTILGFAGNTAPDHIDHLHGLPAFHSRLTERAEGN